MGCRDGDGAVPPNDEGVEADLRTLVMLVAAVDAHAYRLSWGGEQATAASVEAALSAVCWPREQS